MANASLATFRTAKRTHTPILMYGALIFCRGIVMYLAVVLLVFPRYLLGMRAWLDPTAEWPIWYLGVDGDPGNDYFDKLSNLIGPDTPQDVCSAIRRADTFSIQSGG